MAVLLALAAPAAAQQQVERVRFPLPADDPGLTPYTFEVNYPLVALVYDTLAWRDEDGVPRPWLAESIRRQDDGLTVRIELRDGARWHDGRPVTARDVAFTFRHVAERPHPRFTPQVRDIRSVAAIDRDTVLIHLRRPSLGLLDQPLADVPILPRHLWSDLPAGEIAPPGLPVGSGPYRLVRHERRRAYELAAVEDYFRGRPTVGRIEIPIVRQAHQMAEALTAGRADAILAGPAADDLRGPGVDAIAGVSYAGTLLMLNVAEPPFDRLAVRRAVARALDLERIARAAGGASTTDGVAPADRGYVSPDSPWAPDAPLHEFDAAAARVAFAEQGIPPRTVLAPAGNPVALEAGRHVVAALRRAGGRARLLERSAEAIGRAVGQDGSDPDFQAAILGAPALASYDPAFLGALFGSREPLNLSGYRSAAFDRLAARLSAASSEPSRRQVADALLRRLARDLPVVPLVYAQAGFAHRPAVFDGWVFVRGTGILDKQSFLRHGGGPVRRTAAARDPLDALATDETSLLPLVLGGAGLVALAGGVALFRRGAAR